MFWSRKTLYTLGLLDKRPVLGLKDKFLVGQAVLGAMAQSFPLRANNYPLVAQWRQVQEIDINGAYGLNRDIFGARWWPWS